MKLGQKVTVSTEFAMYQNEQTGMRTLQGTVIYIHPRFHYVVLEYEVKHGKFREAFTPMELAIGPKRRKGEKIHGQNRKSLQRG